MGPFPFFDRADRSCARTFSSPPLAVMQVSPDRVRVVHVVRPGPDPHGLLDEEPVREEDVDASPRSSIRPTSANTSFGYTK